MSHEETLILGIGNTLLSDEGAGIHALNLLQTQYPATPDLIFLDGGTLSFTLAPWIEDCTNLIVFDAAELHLPPGSIKTLVNEEMDTFLGSSKRSVHEVGLLDLIHIARITDNLPRRRALIGIQPEIMTWGMRPTPAVAAALELAVGEAKRLIAHWQTKTGLSEPEAVSKVERTPIDQPMR